MTRARPTVCSSRTLPGRGRCAGNDAGCTNACGYARDARTTARTQSRISVWRYGRNVLCSTGAELPLNFIAGRPKPTDEQVTELLLMQAHSPEEELRIEAIQRNFHPEQRLAVRAGKQDVAGISKLNVTADGKRLSAVLLWGQQGWESLHAGAYSAIRPLYETNAKDSRGEPIGTLLQGAELVVTPTTATRQKGTPMPLFATTPSVQSIVDQVNAQPGRNATEKANAYLLANRPGHAQLPWAEQIRAADAFSRTLMSGKLPEGVVLASARPAPGSLPDLVKEINAAPGRNHLERINAMLCNRRAGHKALPYDQQILAASKVSEQVLAGAMPTI